MKLKKHIAIAVNFCAFAWTEVAHALAESEPATIPCAPNLPCIQEATQKSRTAVWNYIFNEWGATFLKGFLGFAAIACVIFIIVGGMQLHIAAGNDEEIGKAKKTLTWAIVGLFIVILSTAIVAIISNLPLST